MTDLRVFFITLMACVLALLGLLALLELFLYHLSGGIARMLVGRIKVSKEMRKYVYEGALSIASLAMTVMLNAILVLVLLLCFIVLVYSIVYLTSYFPLVLAAVVGFLIAVIYVCIRLTRRYNLREEG